MHNLPDDPAGVKSPRGEKAYPPGVAAGLARRDAAHAQHELEHAHTLLLARRLFGRWLLEHGTGTADDVQDLIRLPATANPKLLGAVPKTFAARRWIVAEGQVRSRRPQAHARLISKWVLTDPVALSIWLQSHPMPVPAGVQK